MSNGMVPVEFQPEPFPLSLTWAKSECSRNKDAFKTRPACFRNTITRSTFSQNTLNSLLSQHTYVQCPTGYTKHNRTSNTIYYYYSRYTLITRSMS